MEFNDYLTEFATDWRLAGRAASTAETYCAYLRQLEEHAQGNVTLLVVKQWLEAAVSAQTARGRARAVRAFAKWSLANDGPEWTWWAKVPLSSVAVVPQPTVGLDDYERAMRQAQTVRDRLVIELLWSSGLRVSELARLTRDDVSLADRYVVVRLAKSGRPRLAPISDRVCRLIRRLPEEHQTLLGMSSGAIQQLVRRLGLPSPHAWRRGWAVHALRSGVSETSLRAAAGWSSGAMVARYTSAASHELAIAEFVAQSERHKVR